MQEQEYSLVVPQEKIYDQIYQDYLVFLKQAKIMVSEYYDSLDLTLLKSGIVFRFRIDDGKSIVQIKKKVDLTADNLLISESKEEVQSSLAASKGMQFIKKQYPQVDLQKVLTLRTLRQLYYCDDFDFILDKTQYENHLTGQQGTIYEIEMEILNLNKGDIKFIQELGQKYNLQKNQYTKIERILLTELPKL